MLLVLAMLMTMFVGVGTASAATTTYSCLQAPYLAKDTTVHAANATLGTILVNWDVLMGGPQSAIISLPNGLEFNVPSNPGMIRITKPGDQNYTTVPVLEGISKKEAKITVPSVGAAVYNDVQIAILLNNVKVTSSATAGAAEVTFNNISGLFPPGKVTIGNITGGAAQVTVVDTVTITEGGATEVEFTIQEDTALGLKAENDTVKFRLPKGFSWVGTPVIKNVADNTTFTTTDFTITKDDRDLKVRRDNNSLPRSMYRITAYVEVDETEASFGDVNVSISGKTTLVPGTLLIGTYSDYGYTVAVDEKAEILSGRDSDDATIVFNIKENVKGSLLDGRTLYLTLPDGVEWMVDGNDNLIEFDPTIKDGSLTLTSYNVVKNKHNVVKATIQNPAGSDKGKVEIEANVKVAANYVGDIDVELTGSAGIDETITVAEAIAPLTGSIDVIEVKIGSQDQKAGDIVITEAVKEALISGEKLTLRLPAGVSWSKLPSVTVDGDLTLGTITRGDGPSGTSNGELGINVRGQSDKPSSIKISDVYLSVDRTVPEGDVKISVGGDAINAAKIENRGTALSLLVAKVVTPAPSENAGSGEFRIGSNIYYVGGAAKVMDVAPYIKDSRTYVPMRYAAEIIGAEVVWDDAARTVTLTKGDDVAVFTIGSTTYTVNGEAMTADVAPEIANSRTMLPARFVAEAFGAVVGWDAGTQTVLIQK